MRKKSFARKKKKAKWREALLAVHADDYDNVYETKFFKTTTEDSKAIVSPKKIA